jgi:hypothetical protein
LSPFFLKFDVQVFTFFKNGLEFKTWDAFIA